MFNIPSIFVDNDVIVESSLLCKLSCIFLFDAANDEIIEEYDENDEDDDNVLSSLEFKLICR